ncbi:MAG: hypothetical protein RJQ14_15810, partial [Marinoscillum sp.]
SRVICLASSRPEMAISDSNVVEEGWKTCSNASIESSASSTVASMSYKLSSQRARASRAFLRVSRSSSYGGNLP